MTPEEAEELGAEAAPPPRKHYFTGYVVQVGAHGYKHEPHPFICRAEYDWQVGDLVRKEMGLSDRDEVHIHQTIGFDDV